MVEEIGVAKTPGVAPEPCDTRGLNYTIGTIWLLVCFFAVGVLAAAAGGFFDLWYVIVLGLIIAGLPNIGVYANGGFEALINTKIINPDNKRAETKWDLVKVLVCVLLFLVGIIASIIRIPLLLIACVESNLRLAADKKVRILKILMPLIVGIGVIAVGVIALWITSTYV